MGTIVGTELVDDGKRRGRGGRRQKFKGTGQKIIDARYGIGRFVRAMRRARIKVKAETGEAVYHCMTRVVHGERVIDEVGREVLRKQLWQVADYSGVQILTYDILSNHFHVLVKVPLKTLPADEELLRPYQLLYPKPTKYQMARLEVIKAQLRQNDPEAVAWRRRQHVLMGEFWMLMNVNFLRSAFCPACPLRPCLLLSFDLTLGGVNK